MTENTEIVTKVLAEIKLGDYIWSDNAPYKVLEISRSKPGKTGRPKVHVIARNILTQRKLEILSKPTHTIQIAAGSIKRFSLVEIDENYLYLKPKNTRENTTDPVPVEGVDNETLIELPPEFEVDRIKAAVQAGEKLDIITFSSQGQEVYAKFCKAK